MKILLANNQGGAPVLKLNCAIGDALADKIGSSQIDVVVWLRTEAAEVRAASPKVQQVHVYEEFLNADRVDWRPHVERIVRDYPEVNWSAVVASERSFTDSSFLLGGAGHRIEEREYVLRLVVNTVCFFEDILGEAGYHALICQTADSFFTHVLFKVACHFGIKIFAITPAWLQENGRPGCFFTNDEYLHCDSMVAAYRSLVARPLSSQETERAENFRKTIIAFDGNKAFYSVSRKNFGRNPLSPNIWRLPGYIAENLHKDKYLHYTRIDPIAKARANAMRIWRKWRSRSLIGRPDTAIPTKSVFFALHFQPEQSTLVGGIFYANQIGVIENVLKSLPLDHTLVLKEHPAGRGARPAWQYRHLTSFPNVVFCDAPSKEIAAQAAAVMTISGTIAVESLALNKPTIVLGHSFFDYSDLLYRVAAVEELPELLHRVLIGQVYERRHDRDDLTRKFLLSYLAALVPYYPIPENAPQLADALVRHFVSADLLRNAA